MWKYKKFCGGEHHHTNINGHESVKTIRLNMKFSNTDERLKLNKAYQKSIFENFSKEFKSDSEASKYLRLQRWAFSSYKNCRTRYVPLKVINHVLKFLNISLDRSQVRFSGNLTEIRKLYVKRTYPVLKAKYGRGWGKIVTKFARDKFSEMYGCEAKRILWESSVRAFEEKYGKDWHKIISQKGVHALKNKYGKKMV